MRKDKEGKGEELGRGYRIKEGSGSEGFIRLRKDEEGKVYRIKEGSGSEGFIGLRKDEEGKGVLN